MADPESPSATDEAAVEESIGVPVTNLDAGGRADNGAEVVADGVDVSGGGVFGDVKVLVGIPRVDEA